MDNNPVIDLDSIPENGCRIIFHNEIPLAVFKNEGGVYALDNRCPHRGGSLGDGDIQNGIVTCPLHEWKFIIKTGICTQNTVVFVQSYPVEVANNEVIISLG